MQVFIKGTGTKATLTQREYVAAGGDSRFFAFICESGDGIIIPTFTDEGDTHYGQTSHLTGKSVFELWQDIQEQNCDRWAGQSSLQSEILFGLSPFQINIPNAPSRFCFHGPEQDLLSLWKQYVYSEKHNSSGHRKNLCGCCRTVLNQKRKKAKAIAYKGGACQICGYSQSTAALCFHHRNPDEKYDSISRIYSMKWEVLRAELDKCDLLCLNCHAEKHEEAWRDRIYSRSRFPDTLE